MNFKTKAVALLAGSALALSIASGAMAQDDPPSVPVNATLDEGTCSLTLSVDQNGSFGNWVWGGTGWGTNSDRTVTLTGVVKSGDPSGCTVGLDFNGLSTAEVPGPGLVNSIGNENFTGTYQGQSDTLSNVLPNWGGDNVPSATYTIDITLNQVPNNVIPGDYDGTITSTIENTQ